MSPATYRRSNPAETDLERRVVAQIGPIADPEALEIFLGLVRKIQRKARGTRIERKITLFLDGYSRDAYLQVDAVVKRRREALKLAGRVLTLSKYDEKRCELQELKVRVADKPLLPGSPGWVVITPIDAAGEAMATRMRYETRPMSASMYGSFVELGHDQPRKRAAEVAASLPAKGAADLVLVGCSKCKQEGKHPAKDLYTGDYWDKKRAYAEASGRPWAILSAKHHLIAPDKVIESYDKGMPGVGSSRSDSWGRETANQILRWLHKQRCPLRGAVVEIHAGKLYVAPIRARLEEAGITVRTPMQGMGIGRQKKWYNDQERAGKEGPLVADEAGCIKTPATRLKSCSIQEWVDNLAKIMGRKTTSKRDDTVRAHYRALTRAMIESATEVANIRAALKPLRKWSMIHATDAEKQLRSQQIGWLADRERELAPSAVAELEPAAPRGAALVEDKDGCVVTPGTKIKTCFLAQWNTNQDKITARKLSSKRSQDLRQHQRALTRTMIEEARYPENIRNTLMRLRAMDMKQATDAAKQLRSQQIGWLLARELAVSGTPEAADRKRTRGELEAKLDLDQVYYADPGLFFELVGFERRTHSLVGSPWYAIVRQWDATTKTAPGRAPTSELAVDSAEFRALRRTARPVALRRMAEIPALPPAAAQQALDDTWKLVVSTTPFDIERDNVQPRYAPFALDVDEKRSKPPVWVFGEPGATRGHSEDASYRRRGRYVIGVDLAALPRALSREEVMRPGLMQGYFYMGRALRDGPYALRKLSTSLITVDRIREDPTGAVVEFRTWKPTPGSSLADATRHEFPLDSEEWAAISSASRMARGRSVAAETPPVPSIRPREDSPGSWSLLVDGRAVAEGLKNEPRWALLSLGEADYKPTWTVVPVKSEKDGIKRRNKIRDKLRGQFVFVVRTQGRVAPRPTELEPGQVVKRGKGTRRRYVVIGRDDLGRYELAALSGDNRGASLRSIELAELSLDKDQTVSFSGKRARELEVASKRAKAIEAGLRESDRRKLAPAAPAELAPPPAALAPQPPAELTIPPGLELDTGVVYYVAYHTPSPHTYVTPRYILVTGYEVRDIPGYGILGLFANFQRWSPRGGGVASDNTITTSTLVAGPEWGRNQWEGYVGAATATRFESLADIPAVPAYQATRTLAGGWDVHDRKGELVTRGTWPDWSSGPRNVLMKGPTPSFHTAPAQGWKPLGFYLNEDAALAAARERPGLQTFEINLEFPIFERAPKVTPIEPEVTLIEPEVTLIEPEVTPIEPEVTPIEPELEEAAATPDITIEASTEGGIVLSGDTRKWKDAIKAIRYPRFRFSRRIPGWYVQGTRGKAISREKVAAAAGALRSAGAWVFVSYGEELSYAERQELAAARSEERVERLEEAADKAEARAEAAYKSGRAIGEHIPMGQPILVGHHSERRHRRDIERIGRAMDKTVEETKKAAELRRRAEAAESRQERLEDPGAIYRKLEKLRAELRRWESILAGTNTATGYKKPGPEYAERARGYAAEAEEKIAYWEAELEHAGGLDVAGETVKPGDRISGRHITNAVILAVNKKSYRVESPPNSIPFSMSQYEYKIELERATGHRPAGSQLERERRLATAYRNLATIYEPLAESFEGVKYGGDKYSKSLVRKAKSYRNKATRHDKAADKLEAAAAAYAAREKMEWRPAATSPPASELAAALTQAQEVPPPQAPTAPPAATMEDIADIVDELAPNARLGIFTPTAALWGVEVAGDGAARVERIGERLATSAGELFTFTIKPQGRETLVIVNRRKAAEATPARPSEADLLAGIKAATALAEAELGRKPAELDSDFAVWFVPFKSGETHPGTVTRKLRDRINQDFAGTVYALVHCPGDGTCVLTLRADRRPKAPPDAELDTGSARGATIPLNWSDAVIIYTFMPTGSGGDYSPEQHREFAPLVEAMKSARETGRVTLTADEAILLARVLWEAETTLEAQLVGYAEAGRGRRAGYKTGIQVKYNHITRIFDRLRKAARLRRPAWEGWAPIPRLARKSNPGYPVEEAKRRVMVSLAPDVRKAGWTGPGLGGYCYVASEALAELADEPLTPYKTIHEGSTHWFVRDPRGKVIDLTASQFKTPVPYERAAATPWLEPAPRRQSGMLIQRARRANPDLTAPAERELAAWTPSLFGTVELERGPAPWAWRLSLVEPDGRRIRVVDVDELGRRTFYTREEQLASPEAELAWSRAPTGAYYAAANAVDLVRLLRGSGEEVPWELLAYLPDERRRGLKGRLSRELAGTREDMYRSVMSDDQPEISRSHAKVGFLSDAISQTGKRRKNPAIEQPAQWATLPGMQGCGCNECKAGRACCGDASRVTAGGSIRRANPPDYTPRQISDLTATARSSGAVGANAVVPKLVGKLAAEGDHILDYGAGPAELHARRLRKRGYRVNVYEVGDNRGPTHDPRALSKNYDIVYASNVINVQPDGPAVRGVLDDLAKSSRGGLVVVNYPTQPRKPGVQPATVERWLRDRFGTVSNVGTPSSPVWIAEQPSSSSRKSNPKITRSAVYVHRSALAELTPRERELVRKASRAAAAAGHGKTPGNVIKVHHDGRVSFLEYPDFDKSSNPHLSSSLLVDPGSGNTQVRRYRGDKRPTLHKKALMTKRRANPGDEWIGGAIKRPGRIHRHFGIPEDEPIPLARINAEIATLKAKRKREGRYTKAELSLLRALYLARRLKGYARERDEAITTDEERKRGHNPRVDNPITAMTLAQLAPVLAQLMIGSRVVNPTELAERPYSQLPARALFVRSAPVNADELELYAKIDDATARAVIGLQRGCNCKMSGTETVITTHRRINRLPRRRRT